VRVLSAHDDAQVLAGGTDLMAWMLDDMIQPGLLVDIKGIEGLNRMTLEGRRLTLGCGVTFSEVQAAEVIRECAPLLREMAGQVASVGIRNRATVTGNICSAVPCTDAGASLLVYDALVHVVCADGERDIPLDEWFVGPRRTVRQPGELVTGVSFDVPEPPHGACWVKLGRYRGEDLAQASVAVLALQNYEYRIAFGSVAPRPLRGRRIEELLSGRPLEDERVAEAVEMVPEIIAPITDIRATREYRMEMVKVMLERGLRTAVARRDGHGPAYGTSVI
jgi:carbon-monoxide dehydrogenase medium subunit